MLITGIWKISTVGSIALKHLQGCLHTGLESEGKLARTSDLFNRSYVRIYRVKPSQGNFSRANAEVFLFFDRIIGEMT